MTFYILTLFPKLIAPYLSDSILARAKRAGKLRVVIKDLRRYGGKRYRIDDRPYGGGPGMVLRAEPVIKATESIKQLGLKPKIIILSPGGKKFTNQLADKLSRSRKPVVLIAGRYEGIDARVKKVLRAEEISIGDYTLTGGELPALVVIDAVARRLPGVLGDDSSVEERRIASHEVYTRPEEIKIKGRRYRVPKVLLSGHHKKIDDYRLSTGRS